MENGIFPHGLIGFNPNMPGITYDPEGAKALLAEAGYADGFTMEIAADMSASDTMNMALEIIKEQLAQVGIDAQIKNYDESTWLETRSPVSWVPLFLPGRRIIMTPTTLFIRSTATLRKRPCVLSITLTQR